LAGLPAAPDQGKAGTFSFEIAPTVKPRPKAKALPLEAQVDANVQERLCDLAEWFQFPDTGTWTVRAVIKTNDATLRSSPITVSIRKPDKSDPERPAMERIHHVPWSNYETNAFCGDTFDVVKRWPNSRFAKYCQYWNARHSQHKKDHAKALESYKAIADKGTDFALADHAAYGVVESLCALERFAEAQKANRELQKRLQKRDGKAAQTAVQQLSQAMAERIDRKLAQGK
jgi:hypothetical protein